MSIRAIELFAGGGGLLLGTSSVGVNHLAAVEWDKWACDTLRENANNGHRLVAGLPVIEDDVRNLHWDSFPTDVDLVTGGPPCQPFSLGGKSRANADKRDMFPAAAMALRELAPKAFIFENVKGLTRTSFHEYYSYILLRLSHPDVIARPGERWEEHLARLQQVHTTPSDGLQYNVVDTVVDAADYGVPQHRHRVFIVGFRSDINAGWNFPQPTHSGAALVKQQMSGEYFERHRVSQKQRIIAARSNRGDDSLLPWRTVRDALYHMPGPLPGGTPGWLDHTFQPGAKVYPGHTGSPIDEPSKALKAGDHGVPGGENMIRFPDGSVRYFSIREAARVQTFPDDYALHGSWGEAMRQLGNAVPVDLAATVVGSVVEHLSKPSQRKLKAVQ